MIRFRCYPRILAVAAFFLALVFAVALLAMGLMKYHSVIAGGSNFHDFPVEHGATWRLVIGAAYAGLIGLYCLWLWPPETGAQSFSTQPFGALLKQASPFLLLAFLAYAYSSDGYLYLHYGAMALQGVNPYIHAAKEFGSPLSPFLHWSQSATYGPVAMAIFGFCAGFVPLSPLLAFFVLKGCCLLAHVLNAYLIHRSLPDSPHQSRFAAIYLLNPVLLNEFVSNVHVDVFLTTTVIIFMGCLYQRRYVGAIFALWAGCLTKTLPILWIPLLVGYLIQRRQWRSLAGSALLSLCLIGLLSATVFPSLAAWRSLVNPGVAGLTARSLYHGLNVLLDHVFGVSLGDRQAILMTLNRLAYGGFLVFYAGLLLQPYRRHFSLGGHTTRTYREADLVRDLGWLTLVLFLGVTPWLMPWYSSGLVAIALLSRHAPRLRLISLVFCLSPGLVVGAAAGGGLDSLVAVGVTVGPAIALLVQPKFAPGPSGMKWGL